MTPSADEVRGPSGDLTVPTRREPERNDRDETARSRPPLTPRPQVQRRPRPWGRAVAHYSIPSTTT